MFKTLGTLAGTTTCNSQRPTFPGLHPAHATDIERSLVAGVGGGDSAVVRGQRGAFGGAVHPTRWAPARRRR